MNKMVWAACLVCLTSCASTHDKRVYIDTKPQGAIAKIGEARCETPCDMLTPKSDSYIVQVSKAGYKDEQVQQGLSQWEKSPWVVGAAATATIGMLVVWPEMIPVAVISGLLSMNINASNDTVHVTMKPKERSQ